MQGTPQRAAALLERVAQIGIDQGGQHDAGLGLDALDDMADLIAVAHQPPQMRDRLEAVELHHAGARHRGDRLAGGVGDQVKVEAIGRQSL